MSFGFSPTDAINLVQFSARLYVAFKDANDNSEAQVKGFVTEFTAFHHCLEELAELMKEYGKPLPFPYPDFQETLKRCEETIKPYATHLIDRKMSLKKFTHTIKYIGKENELDNLRKQMSGHYQAIQMCINFLQLRLHLESAKQTQRLLDSAPFRTVSFGSHYYTTNALGSSSRTAPNALPAPSEADELYRDWQAFSRWLKSEDDRVAAQAGNLIRPLSLGGTPTAAQGDDEQTAAVLYHLRRELEDAIMVEENRAKRGSAAEKRTNLSPSDAIRQEVRNMPQIPLRTYTLDTENSGNFSRFDTQGPSMSDSAATIRPEPVPTTPSPTSPRTRSPQLLASYFGAVNWGDLSPSASPSQEPQRTPSVSTDPSSMSTPASPDSRFSVSGLGISTTGTSPEDHLHPLRSKLSAASLVSIALGAGALQWNKLCRKAQVERTTSNGVESRECDLDWRYREDAGISIRSVYRSSNSKEKKVWITQHFPATGPSIPLTTSYPDGDVSADFPRASFGKLEKRCIDIKYTFADTESSLKLQTLLYTNNGKDDAELLYDRPVVTISSNLNKPECRGKNIRLWRRSEAQEGTNGFETVDVLVLLFFTSAIPEEKAHWVEEPHYVFQWLDESVYEKKSEKLQLVFSKEPGKWTRDKVFRRRTSSRSSEQGEVSPGLRRSGTISSVVSSSAASVRSTTSFFGGGRQNVMGKMNRFQYSDLEIRFQSKVDRRDFLEVWRKYVKRLDMAAGG